MANGWLRARAITVDHTKVAADLTNYAVLVNGTYSYLKTVANGGHVRNTDGFDIIFTDSYNSSAKLDWEIENYNPVTGNIQAWVRLPAVSSSVDTIFFMFYDNVSISTFQGDVPGTWNSSFKGVYHLSGDQLGTGYANTTDSTVNDNDGTPSGLLNEVSVVGIVDGGCLYSGAGDGIQVAASASLRIQDFSMSLWAIPQSIGGFGFGLPLAAESANAGITSGWNLSVSGADNKIKFRYFDGSAQLFSSTITLTNGVTYFLTLTWNQTAGELKIYNNNALIDTVTTGTTPITYSSDDFYIGGPLEGGIGIGGYGGIMDEFRFFSGVQALGWITTEYNNEFSPSTFYSVSDEIVPFQADCGNPPDGTQGVFYTHTFPTPTGGGVPPFFFALLTRDDTSYVPEDVINNITLNGITGVWSGYPAAPGTYLFVLDVFDALSVESKVDCEITIGGSIDPPNPPTPGGGGGGTGPGGGTWIIPNGGWSITEACARQGHFGLQHTADGSDAIANNKISSNNGLTVVAGWTLYTYLFIKGSGGADGTVGIGFQFYDVNNIFLSESYIFSSGSPTTWTQFTGNITVPAGAVTAYPIVQVIEHRTGTWCIDDVYSVRSGGQFLISSIKHYFDDYTSYR